jgi:hypothetical protein
MDFSLNVEIRVFVFCIFFNCKLIFEVENIKNISFVGLILLMGNYGL